MGEGEIWSSNTGCSSNIVFFRRFKNIFRTLFSLGVSVCTHTREVEHQRCSRTGRVQKIQNFKEKTQYLMNTLYSFQNFPSDGDNRAQLSYYLLKILSTIFISRLWVNVLQKYCFSSIFFVSFHPYWSPLPYYFRVMHILFRFNLSHPMSIQPSVQSCNLNHGTVTVLPGTTVSPVSWNNQFFLIIIWAKYFFDFG